MSRDDRDCPCSSLTRAYGVGLPGEVHHRDCEHWHRELRGAEVFVTHGELIVTGNPEGDETHNCDALGCTSVSHVLYRFSLDRQASSDAARDVLAERERQKAVEGWVPEHDDEHVNDEIAAMAAFYAMPPGVRDWSAESTGYGDTFGQAIRPDGWEPKVGERRRELVKAGALILAEIERVDRAALASTNGGHAA